MKQGLVRKSFAFALAVIVISSFTNCTSSKRTSYSTSNYATWEIINESNWGITINYEGPEKGSVYIPANQKKNVKIKQGSYSLKGVSDKPNTNALKSSQYFEAGKSYRDPWYIKTSDDTKTNATVEFKSVKFFESDNKIPSQSNRQYKSQFTKSSTRFVYYELYVKNLLYNQRPNTVKVVAKYYSANGALEDSPEHTFTLSQDWDYANLCHGSGWNTGGKWSAGDYRVEFYVEGNKIGEGKFNIANDVQVKDPLKDGKTQLEFEFIKFYEGIDGAQAPEASEESKFATKFSKKTTRFVHSLVGAKNLLYNVKDQKIMVVLKYYNPDGSLLGTVKITPTIKSDWENTDVWGGEGHDRPGKWEKGTYRVEVFFDDRKVSESKFEITE